MKFRNNWKGSARQWDKLMVRLRISALDIFTLEVDFSREFYLITVLNFTIKNR
jgi:hypothetical protein